MAATSLSRATKPYGPLVETHMRLVTWNLWWRLGDWRARLELIAETLCALQPDVVCLQEVWKDSQDNQAALLAKQLDMMFAFAPERVESGVHQGIALLSRWPLTDVAHQVLPSPREAKDHNVVLRSVAQGPRGPLLIATTHLVPYPHRSAAREQQVRALIEFAAETPKNLIDPFGRTLIAGDFNAPPDSDEIRLLTGRREPHTPGWVFVDAWEAAGDGSPGYTVTKNNPNSAPLLLPNLRWDYIFARWPFERPGGVGHPLRAEVVAMTPRDGVVASDHNPVLADLRY